MSYSFQVKAATKAEVKEVVAAKFDETIATFPVHARDRDAVLANANAVIDLLADDDTKDVYVSCNGYMSWMVHAEPQDAAITGASISCSASHQARA